MKPKQIDIELDFVRQKLGGSNFTTLVENVNPIDCPSEKDDPTRGIEFCKKTNVENKNFIVGCGYCQGVNVWINKCLCIYDGQYKKNEG